MRMSEKCHNNNSDYSLTSRRTDGGKNVNETIESYTNASICTFFFHPADPRGIT